MSGRTGVPVTDHAEEVLRYELEFATSPFPVGVERCAIHLARLFKYGDAIVKAAQVKSVVQETGSRMNNELVDPFMDLNNNLLNYTCFTFIEDFALVGDLG